MTVLYLLFYRYVLRPAFLKLFKMIHTPDCGKMQCCLVGCHCSRRFGQPNSYIWSDNGSTRSYRTFGSCRSTCAPRNTESLNRVKCDNTVNSYSAACHVWWLVDCWCDVQCKEMCRSFVCERECVSVSVCVWVCERECVCVCVWERERERESVSVSVCVFDCERECVSVRVRLSVCMWVCMSVCVSVTVCECQCVCV